MASAVARDFFGLVTVVLGPSKCCLAFNQPNTLYNYELQQYDKNESSKP